MYVCMLDFKGNFMYHNIKTYQTILFDLNCLYQIIF
jgi:hypothetical protein